MTAFVEPWGAIGLNDLGDGGDGNYTGLVFGQLIAPPFFPPAAVSDFTGGQVLLASFTVEILQGAYPFIDWSVDLAPVGGGVILQVFDAGDNSLTDVFVGNFGGGMVNIIPAPSAMALLGLGGLVGRRRR